jgi:hypothetical protein
MLAGPWRGGERIIQIFDGVAIVSVPAVDVGRSERSAFGHDLDALVATLEEATGFVTWDREGGAPFAHGGAAATLPARHARDFDRLAMAVRRDRLQRLGAPSLNSNLTMQRRGLLTPGRAVTWDHRPSRSGRGDPPCGRPS